MRKLKAFSLAELLIVIAIIGIMSVVGFVSLSANKTHANLTTAQREVASAIKLAQSYALQGKAQGGSTPCGYGFRFTNPTNYEVFYNTPASGTTCDQDNAVVAYLHFKTSAPVSQTAETGSLKNNVTLTGIADYAETEVYFTVPFGRIYDGAGAALSVDKILTLSATGGDRTITVQKGGGVVEN